MTAVHGTGQKGGIYRAAGKNLVPGSAQMLLLRLLAERDMYGYQRIEELAQRSNDTFALKAGTLYPLSLIHISSRASIPAASGSTPSTAL